jgi:hypothetical protein
MIGDVFRLDCGERVSLRGLHCKTSWEGMDGRADLVARRILQRAPKFMDQTWGKRNTLLFPFELNEHPPTIPQWQLHALLINYGFKLSEEADGSQLEVILFRKTIVGCKIEDLVFDAVRSIDWRTQASDWWAF